MKQTIGEGNWKDISDDINENFTELYNSSPTSRTASAVDYNPSALTTDSLIAITDTSSARAVTISSEDVASGTPTAPRHFVIKDESMLAGTNNITISLESGGTIDGAATAILDTNGAAINLYIDGTNGWIY